MVTAQWDLHVCLVVHVLGLSGRILHCGHCLLEVTRPLMATVCKRPATLCEVAQLLALVKPHRELGIDLIALIRNLCALSIAMLGSAASRAVAALSRVGVRSEHEARSALMAAAKLDLDVRLVVQVLGVSGCIFHCNQCVLEVARPLLGAVREGATSLCEFAQLLALCERHLEIHVDALTLVRHQRALNVAVPRHLIAIVDSE
mmetsp:Transcript_116477/g.301870  ORF Transcript_116477/g.301870 Transcript_116477/m.301870 type:complete len:203 (+) Transcript_116477:528-1136(+)